MIRRLDTIFGDKLELHSFGCRYAQYGQGVLQDLGGTFQQVKSGLRERSVFGNHPVLVIEAVETAGQFGQIVGQAVRLEVLGTVINRFRQGGQKLDQLQFLGRAARQLQMHDRVRGAYHGVGERLEYVHDRPRVLEQHDDDDRTEEELDDALDHVPTVGLVVRGDGLSLRRHRRGRKRLRLPATAA